MRRMFLAAGLLAAMVGGARAGAEVLGRHEDYRQWVTGLRVRQRSHQASVYALERRWADAPFWERRRRGLRPGLLTRAG